MTESVSHDPLCDFFRVILAELRERLTKKEFAEILREAASEARAQPVTEAQTADAPQEGHSISTHRVV